MRHPVLKITGFALTGLVLLSLALTVSAAVIAKKLFYGINYLGIPLLTYSSAVALPVIIVVGLVALMTKLWRIVSARRSRK